MNLLATFLISVVVVTSNYDLYYIASQVADPSVEIYYLADESQEDGINFQIRDFHIRLLNRADIFIHTGTFERRWLQQALWSARNPKILEGREGHIDISKYIDIKNGANCFIFNREYIKRVAAILSGFIRKLSPDFSTEFYEKRLSEFYAEVDEYFFALQTTISSYMLPKFAIYSPCLKYLSDSMNLKYDLLVKKNEDEIFTYGLARDSSEVMKRMNLPLLLAPHNIERSAEIGFMSAEIFILKIPSHLGKKYPNLKSIVNGITFVGDIEKLKGLQEKEKEKEGIIKKEEKKPTVITSIPPETPPAPLEEYAVVTSKYTSIILRDRPSEQAGQAGKIAGGSRVLVLEKQNEWVKITDGKNIGWVRISVLTFEK